MTMINLSEEDRRRLAWDLAGVYEDIRASVENGATSVPDQATLDTIQHIYDMIVSPEEGWN
jgi:hypothetical protein